MKSVNNILKQKKYQLILASKSKRRQDLLKKLKIPFIIRVSKVIEKFQNKNIKQEIMANTLLKAKSIDYSKKALVIAGDTVIVYNNRVFGKPKNRSEAKRFLLTLSGKTHQVLTGLIVYNNVSKKLEKALVTTKVTFKKLSAQDIKSYLAIGEYKDKAGGYGIQAKGSFLVSKVVGDYNNVVGLPLTKLIDLLKKACKKIK
ncbi:MAG: septum formation protein Maf [Candidatus Margulisbacteria bacterium]|nr:septum formation protein Maf [Candidatus Margulisiibacteriota bacterium]